MARLFFAVWPDLPAREALARLATEVAARTGARAVPAAKLHLTLAFLGESGRLAQARDVAALVPGRAFTASFDGLGSFARAGVAWAGMSNPPGELLALAAGLAEQLRAAGFELEDRPFAAHLTLARRIRGRFGPEAIAPIAWQAREFALVESDPGTGRYETRGSWELGAR